MKPSIFIGFLLVLTYSVETTNGQDSVTLTTRKPIPNKNLTSNTVTESSLEAITTTRRPLLQGFKLPCSCLKGQCGCCTGVILERFKQKACMNITYEPDDFAFTAALSLNGRVLYKNSISGKNPPPICIRLPRFRFIQLCVEFSNIYFANRNMHVCIDMEANWEELTLLDFSFDCIRMGVNGVAVIRPEEGGGLPASTVDEEEQTDEDYDDSARNSQLLNATHLEDYELPSDIEAGAKKSNGDGFSFKDEKRNSISVKRLSDGDILISFSGDKKKAFE